MLRVSILVLAIVRVRRDREIGSSGDRVIGRSVWYIAAAMTGVTKPEELRNRTKQFAIEVIRLTRILPNNPEGWVIGKQVLRSATSVAANYRAAGRARSRAEFAAKMGIVVEEADETVFWLDLLQSAAISHSASISPLLGEANELLAIFAASYRTAKRSLPDVP